MNIIPSVKNDYSIGSIVYESWGYEQTNIDFYVIVKKSAKFVTILPMTKISSAMDNNMSTQEQPGEIKANAKPIRRKMSYMNEIEETGFSVGHGWATPYNGKPKTATHYA